jgi:hypothetical protein
MLMASTTAPYTQRSHFLWVYCTLTHGKNDMTSDLGRLPQLLYAYTYNMFRWYSEQWEAFFAPAFACSHASISGSPGDTLTCITKSLLTPSCCDCSVPQHRKFHLGQFQGVARVGFHVCDLPPLSSPCWYTLIYSKSNQNCLNQFLCSSSTKTRSLTRFSWIPSFYFLFNFFLIFFFDFLNTRPSTRKLCLCRRRPCLRKKHPEFFWL